MILQTIIFLFNLAGNDCVALFLAEALALLSNLLFRRLKNLSIFATFVHEVMYFSQNHALLKKKKVFRRL